MRPYKPLIKQVLWAHGCAPLQALIKIKWTFTTPSLAHHFGGAVEKLCIIRARELVSLTRGEAGHKVFIRLKVEIKNSGRFPGRERVNR